VCMSEMLPEVAGEWWWAPNECASLPKEGPLGPVLKESLQAVGDEVHQEMMSRAPRGSGSYESF